MSLSKITIQETEGNNRLLTSEDNTSGVIFYVDSISLSGDSYQVFSLQEAEGFGITSVDYPTTHYHLSEFYRINPSAQLQIKLVEWTGGTHDFVEVYDLVADAEGDVSQIGIYTTETLSTGMVLALQSVLTDLKENEDIPVLGLLQANIAGLTLQALPDLSTSNAPQVAVLIGQDYGNVGANLYNTLGDTIGILGTTLGALGRSSTNESIAWVSQFDMSGVELNSLAFGNGISYKNVSKTQLATLNDKNYIFLLKHYGLNGTYFNSSFTATSPISDYYSIERIRTVNKSRRLLRTALLPELNSPLYLDDDGRLRIETVGRFTSKCEQALDAMRRNGELSSYQIFINPYQDVLSDDTLHIDVKLLPAGVARFINVTLGFAVSLA